MDNKPRGTMVRNKLRGTAMFNLYMTFPYCTLISVLITSPEDAVGIGYILLVLVAISVVANAATAIVASAPKPATKDAEATPDQEPPA